MSRSGYGEIDNWDLIRWRGQVASSIRGKRGQQLLKELAEAMDAMPTKRLITDALESNGEYCALGVIGAKRGIDLKTLDPEHAEDVGKAFNIAHQLAQEVVYLNDEYCQYRTPEERWKYMRQWVEDQLKVKTGL